MSSYAMLGSGLECIMNSYWPKGFDGAWNQYKYHLVYWQLRRQHLIWALERVAILVFLCGGSHYTCMGAAILFYGSTMDTRLYGYILGCYFVL